MDDWLSFMHLFKTHTAHVGGHLDVLLEEGGLHLLAPELEDLVLGAGRVLVQDSQVERQADAARERAVAVGQRGVFQDGRVPAGQAG